MERCLGGPRATSISSFVLGLAVGVTLILVPSCAGVPVRAEVDVLRAQIDKARAAGAKRCAPRELAIAEANRDFAETELEQGNAGRAEEHLAVASEAVRRAGERSKDCGPTQVLIKNTAIMMKVEKLDADGDGVEDNADRCPLVAGPPENGGCPDLDRDADGIPDSIDRCPQDAEDRDGFSDEDGCPDPDNDNDGLVDAKDRCPDVRGPAVHEGCPFSDRDGDGVEDSKDRCPEKPEDKDGFEDEYGCPDPDNDADGVMDADDRCPEEPGIPETAGCPPGDRDGDNLPDHLDKCPDEEGVLEEQGCPRKYALVVLRKEKIEIAEQVHFATGESTILSDSFELLDQVAQVLKDHPKLRVRIEGHTDSVSSSRFNLTLSQDRAEAVRTFLVRRGGIKGGRLVAKGYGETVPLDSNATESGRAANRRVEFNIIAH